MLTRPLDASVGIGHFFGGYRHDLILYTHAARAFGRFLHQGRAGADAMEIQILRFEDLLVGLDILYFYDHQVQWIYGTVSNLHLQARDAAEGTHGVAVGTDADLAGQRCLYG